MSKKEPDYSEDNKIVVSNNYISAVHPDRMNINAMKLFRLVITQCRMTDKKFYQYDFKIGDLARVLEVDRSDIYRDTMEMCKNLMQTLLFVGDGNPRHNWKYKHIFEVCEYSARDEAVTIQLHPDMSELFLRLKSNFTRIPIAAVLTMKSKYGIRLFEVICDKLQSCFPYSNHATEIILMLEEIRKATGTEKQKTYNLIGNVKNKILLPALADIEQAADWKIIVKDVKHARKITGFSIEIWSRSGYEVVQHCMKTGEPLPGRYTGQMPGQTSLFDFLPEPVQQTDADSEPAGRPNAAVEDNTVYVRKAADNEAGGKYAAVDSLGRLIKYYEKLSEISAAYKKNRNVEVVRQLDQTYRPGRED